MVNKLRGLWTNRAVVTHVALIAQTLRTRGGVGIGVGILALMLTTGYFAFGALFGGGAERDLTSGDPQRVVDALATIDNQQLACGDNADVRSKAIATLRNSSPGMLFDRLRADDLSEEEQGRLRANLRELMMEYMKRQVDEYFDAPEDQKEAVLDRHIDEMQESREKRRAYREANQGDRAAREDRGGPRGRRGPPSKAERKKRMESMSPDRAARVLKYRAKLREQANSRGIELGRGPGRGGPGRP